MTVELVAQVGWFSDGGRCSSFIERTGYFRNSRVMMTDEHDSTVNITLAFHLSLGHAVGIGLNIFYTSPSLSTLAL